MAVVIMTKADMNVLLQETDGKKKDGKFRQEAKMKIAGGEVSVNLAFHVKFDETQSRFYLHIIPSSSIGEEEEGNLVFRVNDGLWRELVRLIHTQAYHTGDSYPTRLLDEDTIKLEVGRVQSANASTKTTTTTSLGTSMWMLREKEVALDLKLAAESGHVHVHRVVMASASEPLKLACYCSAYLEASSDEIGLKPFALDVVKFWVEAIYRGVPIALLSLSKDAATSLAFWLNVMQLCDMWQTVAIFDHADVAASTLVNDTNLEMAAESEFATRQTTRLFASIAAVIRKSPLSATVIFCRIVGEKRKLVAEQKAPPAKELNGEEEAPQQPSPSKKQKPSVVVSA